MNIFKDELEMNHKTSSKAPDLLKKKEEEDNITVCAGNYNILNPSVLSSVHCHNSDVSMQIICGMQPLLHMPLLACFAAYMGEYLMSESVLLSYQKVLEG